MAQPEATALSVFVPLFLEPVPLQVLRGATSPQSSPFLPPGRSGWSPLDTHSGNMKKTAFLAGRKEPIMDPQHGAVQMTSDEALGRGHKEDSEQLLGALKSQGSGDKCGHSGLGQVSSPHEPQLAHL